MGGKFVIVDINGDEDEALLLQRMSTKYDMVMRLKFANTNITPHYLYLRIRYLTALLTAHLWVWYANCITVSPIHLVNALLTR